MGLKLKSYNTDSHAVLCIYYVSTKKHYKTVLLCNHYSLAPTMFI